jgi:hypothetical protein
MSEIEDRAREMGGQKRTGRVPRILSGLVRTTCRS